MGGICLQEWQRIALISTNPVKVNGWGSVFSGSEEDGQRGVLAMHQLGSI
jgi:hypothetical protein